MTIFNKHRQGGFTLVELLIATSVFSVVMMISLYSFVHISRFYTKGISIIRTQDAARNLIADLSGQFQLTNDSYGTAVTIGGENILCVGNKAYVYKINTIEDGSGNALASYNRTSAQTCDMPSTGKTALLRKGARVLQLEIDDYTSNVGLYDIDVALLFAPNDGLMTSPAGTDLVDTSAGATAYDQWLCKASIKGSEYCSITRISTTVYKRVN